MIANIIFDNRRPEKYSSLIAEMGRQGISYILWEAIVLPDVISSINASHRQVVEDAKRWMKPEVLIMEDDVYFPAAGGFQYFLSKKPKQFDMYVAGTYSGVREGKATFNVGLHCYIIHERYYNKFLATVPNMHIDTAQIGADIPVCYPMAAIQRPGWSANNGKYVNYNVDLKPEDVYGGLPESMLQQPKAG